MIAQHDRSPLRTRRFLLLEPEPTLSLIFYTSPPPILEHLKFFSAWFYATIFSIDRKRIKVVKCVKKRERSVDRIQ